MPPSMVGRLPARVGRRPRFVAGMILAHDDRSPKPMKIDLHVHSTASDGSEKAGRVVRMAAANGLAVIAVADHDTVGGVAEAIAEAPAGLRVVPAIEISCDSPETHIHLLGYFVDPEHPGLLAHSRRVVDLREERMRAMIERLADLGISVEYDAVRVEGGEEAVL